MSSKSPHGQTFAGLTMDIYSHPIRVKSYWDWLPQEIQEYIMSFVVSQQLIDARNKKSWKALSRNSPVRPIESQVGAGTHHIETPTMWTWFQYMPRSILPCSPVPSPMPSNPLPSPCVNSKKGVNAWTRISKPSQPNSIPTKTLPLTIPSPWIPPSYSPQVLAAGTANDADAAKPPYAISSKRHVSPSRTRTTFVALVPSSP